MCKLHAVHDSVIVKMTYEDRKGGIIVPDSAKVYKRYHGFVYGLVISVGPKYEFRDELKAGDKIIVLRHEGKKFKYEGEEYFKVKEIKRGAPRIAGRVVE